MPIIAPIPRSGRRLIQKTVHKTQDKNHARRLMALLMLHRGERVSTVARILCCARSSVGRWINWFTLTAYQYRLIRLFLWFILSEGLSHCLTDFLPTNIRWSIRFPAHIQIIRPPLHHCLTGFQMFSLMNVCQTHGAALLMAHLALNGILCP